MAASKIYGYSFVDREMNTWLDRVLFLTIGIAIGVVTMYFVK